MKIVSAIIASFRIVGSSSLSTAFSNAEKIFPKSDTIICRVAFTGKTGNTDEIKKIYIVVYIYFLILVGRTFYSWLQVTHFLLNFLF